VLLLVLLGVSAFTLARLGPLVQLAADGVAAQLHSSASAPDIDTETLARRAVAGAAQGREDLSGLLQVLRERRNADGGFASAPGLRSAALDTAWAVLALDHTGQAAAPDAVAARRYLAAQPHADSAGSVRRLAEFLARQQTSRVGWAGDTVVTAWVSQALGDAHVTALAADTPAAIRNAPRPPAARTHSPR
jgi:hypothetical protein